MGHDKLRKFAENETFSCLLQPSAQELLADGYFHLRDHAVKGHWNRFFDSLADVPLHGSSGPQTSGCAGPLPPTSSAGPSLLRSRGWLRSADPTAVSATSSARKDEYQKDIVLELGCGKGEYTIALAERHPERDYIGVDIKGARLWKGAKYATEHRLPNVAFLRTRVEFITAFFAPGEVSEVWLTFSDPQFRSENSRLSSPLFLERYRSFMKPGGVVHLKTDSRFLHEYTRAVCELNGLRIFACTTDLYYGGMSPEPPAALKSLSDFAKCKVPGPGRSADADLSSAGGDCLPACSPAEIPEEVRSVQTFYEKLFLEQGYPITYLSFVIDHDGPYRSPVEAGTFDTDYWRSVEGPRLLFGHDSAETRRQKLKLRDE